MTAFTNAYKAEFNLSIDASDPCRLTLVAVRKDKPEDTRANAGPVERLLMAARKLRAQHDAVGIAQPITRLNQHGEAAEFFEALAALDD